MKYFVATMLIGVVTALAGYPIYDDDHFYGKNLLIVCCCIIIINLIKGKE
jgi:hypothetical protein